jgi:hypothetical protein
MSALSAPIHAATATAIAHGITPDRCEVLQDGSTLVLRLTDSLVARIVQDRDGPRQGTDWFARENAVARHLANHGAPVIPMHPEIPPGPHEHSGYPMNFWQFVTRIEAEPEARQIAHALRQCHRTLESFDQPLPELAILHEGVDLLETLERRSLFSKETLSMLRDRLLSSVTALAGAACQPVHGDAHLGNLMNTTIGLLWTDWEDAFSGPVEWDLSSVIWNARVLEGNQAFVDRFLEGYAEAGGNYDSQVLEHCMVGRAAVMTAWYPVLYPDMSAERKERLRHRLEWLETNGV